MNEAYVWSNPARRSGRPCVGGTRIETVQVAEMYLSGEPWGTFEDGYDLTRSQVLVACWYEATFSRRRKFRAWRDWADNAMDALWRTAYDEVPDPPRAS